MNIQKTRKNVKTVSLLLVLVMMLNLVLPVFTAKAATIKATVEVKKVKYDISDENFPQDGVKKFQTNGKDFNGIPSYMSAYNTEDTKNYGKVEFAAYKLNDAGKALVTDGVASDELKTALKDPATREQYLVTPAVDTKQVLGDEGLAKLDLGDLDPANPEMFAIIEVTPATNGALIVTPAEPMILSLPHITETGAIADLKLVAKNEVAKNSVILNKIDEKFRGVAEAKFELYKNDFNTKIVDLTSDENGKIKIENLTLGKYYLVEKESKYVRDPFNGKDTTNKKYMVSDKGLKDTNNKLFFEVTNERIKFDGSEIKNRIHPKNKKKTISNTIINYMTPFAVKKLTTDLSKAEAGSTLTFEVQAYVPANIADYESYAVKDSRTENTLGAPTLKDKGGLTITTENKGADTLFKFNVDELKAKAGQFIKFTYDMKLADDVNSKSEVKNKISTVFDPSKTTDPTDPNTHPIENTDPHDQPHDDTPGGGTGEDKPGSEVEVKVYKLTVESQEKGLLANAKLAGAKAVIKNAEGKFYAGTNKWVDKQEDAKVFTTVDNGTKAIVEVDGLAKGDYTVVLTGTPQGFKMPMETNKVAKLGTDNQKDSIVIYEFSAIAGLPLTGSDQLIILGIVGIAIIATAVVVLRKKENK